MMSKVLDPVVASEEIGDAESESCDLLISRLDLDFLLFVLPYQLFLTNSDIVF